REEHAVRDEPLAEVPRREVGDHDDAPPDELLGREAEREPRDDLARNLLAEVDAQLEELVLLRDLLGRLHDADPEFDPRELLVIDRPYGLRGRRVGLGRRGLRRELGEERLLAVLVDDREERARRAERRAERIAELGRPLIELELRRDR